MTEHETGSTQDHHLIVVLQCDECGDPRAGCRNVNCAMQSRPYAGEDVVPVEHETGARRGLPGEGTGMTPPPPGFEQPQQVDRLSDIEHPAWAEVDRLRATTVDRSHFDRKIREWIALYDEEQAKRRAAERQLRGAVSLLEQARYCVTYALNCPAHPWHGSDEARKWLIEAARLGGQ